MNNLITSATFLSYSRFSFMEFEDQLQLVTHDLRTYTYNDTLCDRLHEKALIKGIKKCLDTSLKVQQTFTSALLLKHLASEIKRSNLRHNIIWQALDANHQNYLNALEVFTTTPVVPTTDLEHPSTHNTTFTHANAHFGDGYTFNVTNPQVRGVNYQFTLSDSPHLSVFKYQNDADKKSSLKRWTSQTQMAVFNVPTHCAQAIQSKGSWEINLSASPVVLSKLSFDTLTEAEIKQMAEDIAIFLTTEETWNINLLGHTPGPGEDVFAWQNKRCVTARSTHLPVLLTENKSERRQKLLASLEPYPTLLAKVTGKLKEQNLLKDQIDREVNLLTHYHPGSEIKISPSFVLKTLLNQCSRINKQITLDNLKFYAALLLTDIPQKPDAPSCYTYSEKQSERAESIITEQVGQNKEFFSAMLSYLIGNFHFQESVESQISCVINQANDLLSSIGEWLDQQASLKSLQYAQDGFQQCPSKHFWARAGVDFMTWLEELLALSSTPSFHDKLTILRYASERDPENVSLYNKELSQCIQARIQERQSLEILQLVEHAKLKTSKA